MKKLIIISTTLIGLIGLSLVFYQRLTKQVVPPSVQTKSQVDTEEATEPFAVNFDLLKFAGGSTDFEEFRGKPVILNFWASTCPPCKYEMPFFESQYKKYGTAVNFVMVNVLDFQGETKETAKSFMTEQDYTMPAFFEIDRAGSQLFNVNSVPRTYFLDEKGQVVSDHLGAIEEQALEQAITELIAK